MILGELSMKCTLW